MRDKPKQRQEQSPDTQDIPCMGLHRFFLHSSLKAVLHKQVGHASGHSRQNQGQGSPCSLLSSASAPYLAPGVFVRAVIFPCVKSQSISSLSSILIEPFISLEIMPFSERISAICLACSTPPQKMRICSLP